MADIQSTLSKKLGPLPVWGWAAAAGGLASVIVLARRGSATGAASAASGQPNVPYVPSPIIVTPQSMADGTSSVNAPASAPSVPGPTWQHGTPPSNPQLYIWQLTPAGQQQYQQVYGSPWNQGLQPGSSPVPGGLNAYSWQWSPLPAGYTSANGYLAALGQAGMGGGIASMVNYVPGSGGGKLLRHVGPHAHQQYLGMTGMGGGPNTGPWAQDPARGMAGMGGGGHARLQAVSQKTGLPMTRLMSLNPPWKRRRHVHIA